MASLSQMVWVYIPHRLLVNALSNVNFRCITNTRQFCIPSSSWSRLHTVNANAPTLVHKQNTLAVTHCCYIKCPSPRHGVVLVIRPSKTHHVQVGKELKPVPCGGMVMLRHAALWRYDEQHVIDDGASVRPHQAEVERQRPHADASGCCCSTRRCCCWSKRRWCYDYKAEVTICSADRSPVDPSSPKKGVALRHYLTNPT